MDEKPKEVLEKINAGLIKRIYITSVIVCCTIHVVIVAVLLYLDTIIWSAQLIRENIFVMIMSLASLFIMKRVRNGIIELPPESLTSDSRLIRHAIHFLFTLIMICLFFAYLYLFENLIQGGVLNAVGSMSTVLLLISIISLSLAGDD